MARGQASSAGSEDGVADSSSGGETAPRPRLRVGHAWPLGACGLAAPLAEYGRRYPGVRLELWERSVAALRRGQARRAFDVVVAPACTLPPDAQRLEFPPAPWALVTGREGLFGAEGPDWSWLAERPLLLRRGEPWREAQALCSAHGGRSLDVRVLDCSCATLFELVAEGLGWSLGPASLARSFPAVAFHRLPPGLAPLAPAVGWTSVEGSAALRDFVAVLRGDLTTDATA